MPIPNSALTTNWTVDRCTSRTTSSTSAAATLTPIATGSSRVVSQNTVNSAVGTAASIMPRRPPSAFASWARTTASTVSTDALGCSWLWSGWLTGSARSAGCR